MRLPFATPIAAALILLAVAPASAQRAPEWDVCDNPKSAPDILIKSCTKLIDSKDENQERRAYAYFKRGNGWSNKSDFSRARSDYGEAIRLAPDNPLYYAIRGNAWHLDGQPDRALLDFNEAIKLDPKNVRAHRGRSLVLLDNGDLDGALAAVNEAIKFDPKPASSLYTRGTIHKAKGDFIAALADTDEAIRQQPDNSLYTDGRCALRATIGPIGESQAALAECGKSIEKQPNALAFDSRGILHLRLGQFALADFESALQLDPDDPQTMYGRGVAKLRNGDKAGGAKDIQAAKASRPSIGDEYKKFGVGSVD